MPISSGPISSRPISARGLTDISESVESTLSLTDDATQVRELPRASTDNMDSVNDVVAVTLVLPRTLEDTIGVSDSVSEVELLTRNLEDTIGVNDSVVESKELPRSLTDTLTLTQSLTQFWLDDSLVLTDELLRIKDYSLSDTIIFTDSFEKIVISLLNLMSNTLTMTDSVDSDLTHNESVTHSLTLLDEANPTEEFVGEASLTFSDDVVEILKEAQNVSESISLTDFVDVLLRPGQHLEHSINLIQSTNLTRDVFELLEQTVGINDEPVMRFVFKQDLVAELTLTQDWVFSDFRQHNISQSLNMEDELGGYIAIQNVSQFINTTSAVVVRNLAQQNVVDTLILHQSISQILITTRAEDTLTLTDELGLYHLAVQHPLSDINLYGVVTKTHDFALSLCECIDLLDQCFIADEESLEDTLTLTDLAEANTVDIIIDTLELTDSVETNSVEGSCCVNHQSYIPDKSLEDSIGIEDSLSWGNDDLNDVEQDLVLHNTAAYYVVSP